VYAEKYIRLYVGLKARLLSFNFSFLSVHVSWKAVLETVFSSAGVPQWAEYFMLFFHNISSSLRGRLFFKNRMYFLAG